jgi:hypothetical protein
MRLYLRRLMLFWMPVILPLLSLEALLWRAGETWPIARVIRVQQSGPSPRFMRGLIDQGFYRYKYESMKEERPSILAIGSSRVLKFRAEMFGEDSSRFYNAGGLVQSIDDLEHFVRHMPDSQLPRVLLLGIGMWWLNDHWPSNDGFERGVQYDGALNWQDHLLVLRSLVEDPAKLWRVVDGPVSDAGAIGLGARWTGAGFRPDGSLASGTAAPSDPDGWRFIDRERPTVVDRIRTATARFQISDGVSQSRLAALRGSLAGLSRRGVLVLGFAPPLSDEAAALLAADARHQRLWRGYREEVPALFLAMELPFVDASTPATLGLDDRYMRDGFHGEETLHLYILRRLLADSTVAAALPTARCSVERAIASPGTNMWFPDFQTRGLPMSRSCPKERPPKR